MKRFAFGAAVIATLVSASVALAGGSLAGKYTTRIASPAQFKGTWALNFAKNGTYTVADNGRILVHGKYSTSGSKLTLGHETGPAACPKSGTYTWARSGKKLKFTPLSDPASCSGRSTVLAHTFTQAG